MSAQITLHGYWRSSAAYRLRIALNIKGLIYNQVNHDLRIGEQNSNALLAVQPQGLVPALIVDGIAYIQSPAVLEYLDERWPAPPLLPPTREERATVRSMCALIACDIHPLNNLRVLKAIEGLGADGREKQEWIARWIRDAFKVLEEMVARHGNGLAFGDQLSLVDCYLVPQLYSAARFGIDLSPFSRLVAAGEAARSTAAVAAADPLRQPDADRPGKPSGCSIY